MNFDAATARSTAAGGNEDVEKDGRAPGLGLGARDNKRRADIL